MRRDLRTLIGPFTLPALVSAVTPVLGAGGVLSHAIPPDEPHVLLPVLAHGPAVEDGGDLGHTDGAF
ncbi:hypothetical protein ACFY2H_36600 [Streptomyces griseofuscus]|uniref:hypothetical protein n=1 Tax=Streptomyces TaxID=1883 RepID=UPI00160237BE|nr:hypothetical protein [Streptomyces murinus]MBA9050334.1 hypothetical protein [Streptomyces murinus]